MSSLCEAICHTADAADGFNKDTSYKTLRNHYLTLGNSDADKAKQAKYIAAEDKINIGLLVLINSNWEQVINVLQRLYAHGTKKAYPINANEMTQMISRNYEIKLNRKPKKNQKSNQA